jgi:phasin
MATPRKPKSLSAGTPSKLATQMASATHSLEAKVTEAVEAATPTGESTALIAPALNSLMHESADKALSGAREVQENLRCAAEEAIVQTRSAYDRLKHAAEEVTDSIETSYVTATRGFGELNQKAIEGLKAHAEANFEHFKALSAAKSIPEALSLQTDHARKQFEALSSQMKELTALAQKVVVEASEPLKSSLDKSLAA